jgi:hypothetical protein
LCSPGAGSPSLEGDLRSSGEGLASERSPGKARTIILPARGGNGMAAAALPREANSQAT